LAGGRAATAPIPGDFTLDFSGDFAPGVVAAYLGGAAVEIASALGMAHPVAGDASAQIELMSATRADGSVHAEGPAQAWTDTLAPFDLAGLLRSGAVMNLEVGRRLLTDQSTGAELLSIDQADGSVPAEAPAQARTDTLALCDLAGLHLSGAVMNLEVGRRLLTDQSTGAELLSTDQADGSVPAEGPGLAGADNSASCELVGLLGNGAVMKLELGGGVLTDQSIGAELLAAILPDPDLRFEILGLTRTQFRPPAEARGKIQRTVDAMLPVEILRIARGDAAVAGELRGTYIVKVTLTLSDGRVISIAASS
jgi:hypothetical protein